MWTCPECGHQFVTPNTWHSCGRYELEDHFTGKDPNVRQVFDRLVTLLERYGPLTVYAQKTRIVFQVRTRFAAAMTRNKWLILQVWLKRKVDHPLLQRIEMYTYRDFGHIFRLKDPDEIDPDLEGFLLEAYVMGSG